jgi:hypothetical protein
MKVIFNCFF